MVPNQKKKDKPSRNEAPSFFKKMVGEGKLVIGNQNHTNDDSKLPPGEKLGDIVNHRDIDGPNSQESYNEVKKMLDDNPELVNYKTMFDVTIMHTAAAEGDRQLINLFLSYNCANWCLENCFGQTPAARARATGHEELADYINFKTNDVNEEITKINM